MRGFFFLLIVALFAFAVYTPPSPVNIPSRAVQAAVTEQPALDNAENDNVWDGEAGIPADIVMQQEAAVKIQDVIADESALIVSEDDVVPEEIPSEVAVPEDVAIETEVIETVIDTPAESVTDAEEHSGVEDGVTNDIETIEEYVPEPIVEDPVLVLSGEESEEIATEDVEPEEEVNIVEELIQE